MRIFDITLHSVGDVDDFVALACSQPFDLTVGNDHHSVNGKSFMQIFCLDLSSPQQVKMDCTEEEFRQFFDAAERFRN